jgi:transcriptional regulator of NAD metabolism
VTARDRFSISLNRRADYSSRRRNCGQKVRGFDVSTEKILDDGCLGLIDQVKRRVAEALTAEELTECAGGALERYARVLMTDLISENSAMLEAGKDAAVKRRFAEGLDKAGAALREALAESKHRHTVSQVLQRKMFEAESMLRKALKARLGNPTPAVTQATI